MTRAWRKTVAWFCLGAVLFLQLAMAAYACPMRTDGATWEAVAPITQPCQGMDQQRPNLCEQHCVQDSQSANTLTQPAIDVPVLPLMALVVPRDVHVPIGAHVRDALLAIVVNPPPLVRFGVLRI